MQTLSLLIKPASGLCNLRCRYCFYADVADSRAVKNYGMMSEEILETLVAKALSEATDRCVFGFQGGEPTLAGLDFFRKLVEFENRHNRNRVTIEHTLQTNGLGLDAAWAEFFREHRFLVGVSIDADSRLHDQLRPDAAGKGTHRRCLDAVRLLERHGVDFNILSVLTRHMAAHPDQTYNFYKRKGFRHLQFIPCLDGLEEAAGSHPHSLDAAGYGSFLCRLFDLWRRDFLAGDYISIRSFDNYIHMLAGHPPENCGMSGECHTYPLIEADGSVYPCDFYALDRYRLGNVRSDTFTGMLSGEAARKFEAPSRRLAATCQACEYLFLCRGGCRRDREPLSDGAPGQNRFCEAYRLFFQHALAKMQEIARRVFK